MKRHSLTIASLTLLALLAAFSTPIPAAAAETTNLAGRPIRNEFCHGLAYGRVDNDPVLFTAHHCRPDSQIGQPVYNQNGVRIGVWGPDAGTISRWDLAYIKLDAGDWPTNRNRIYRGAVSGANYWTITAQPTTANDCNGRNWNTVSIDAYHNYQSSWTTTLAYRSGWTNGWEWINSEECLLKTNFTIHSTCCDSGTPLILSGYTNRLFAVGTAPTFDGRLGVTPIAYAMVVLDNYWSTRGQYVGAWMCSDATCGPL